MSLFLILPVISDQPILQIRNVSISKMVKVSYCKRWNFLCFLKEYKTNSSTFAGPWLFLLGVEIMNSASGYRVRCKNCLLSSGNSWRLKNRSKMDGWQEDFESKERTEGIPAVLGKIRALISDPQQQQNHSSLHGWPDTSCFIQGWALSGRLFTSFLQNSSESFSTLSKC